jgi:hypothetical protein
MAQTGYTPILIYSSSTAAAAPAAGSLTNSTLGSELAINITDGKLFYKDNANAIQVIGWKTVPTSAGGTGLTSYTAGDLIYYASGTTFAKLNIGSAYQALQVNAGGTAPSWQPSATSVLTAQGDLLYASAANTLARLAKNTTATRYLANTGTTNNPQWDQVNLANGVTGTLPTGNGGTGLTSFTANGIVYASSTSALATGSALTFDGTNLATTGNVVISTSGKGIDFSATPGTGTSELLADYEEGTFTATFLSDGGSITTDATVRYGFYTKVGRQVTILCRVKASAISSPTGDAYVQGLPFTSASTTGLNGIATGYGLNFKNTLTTQMTGVIGASQTLLTLQKYAAGTTTGITADFNSNSEIYFTAVYFTA